MARLPKDSPLSGASGKLGGEIVFKKYADKTVISKMPGMSKVKPSAAQKASRNYFREANLYAQQINKNPELKAAYAKTLLQGESVFHKAKNEYLNRRKTQSQ